MLYLGNNEYEFSSEDEYRAYISRGAYPGDRWKKHDPPFKLVGKIVRRYGGVVVARITAVQESFRHLVEEVVTEPRG